MELRLVADTNIFLECRLLEDLPWHELERDLIVVLLSKPVLDEIDKHKTATGRTRARALETFKRVRALLRDGARETEIRASSPRVILRLLEATAPDARHAGLLDYGRPDDRLVGIVSALQNDDPGHTTELFTDDTGPASTAADLRLPFRMIDDSWRRPPSESTEAKRIRDLEKDLATYRAQEPKFVIGVPGRDNADVTRVARRVAVALTGGEIDEIVTALRAKHPVEAAPIVPQPTVERMATGETVQTVYFSPADDEVARYRDVDHPAWIGRCREVLAKLHEGRSEKEPRIIMRWSINNDGTRPASRVRTKFEAKGRLRLVRLPKMDVEAPEQTRPPQRVLAERLPSPPRPPALRTEVTCAPRTERAISGNLRDALASRGEAIIAREMLGRMGIFEEGHMPRIRASEMAAFSRSIDKLGMAKDLVPHLRAMEISLKGAGSLAGMLEAERILGRAAAITPSLVSQLSLGPLRPAPHDPEAFYWDWPVDEAVAKGALTCDLWRHRTDAQLFEFEVAFEGDGDIEGAIECIVHSENLTIPARAIASVGRAIERLDLRALADRLVEDCN